MKSEMLVGAHRQQYGQVIASRGHGPSFLRVQADQRLLFSITIFTRVDFPSPGQFSFPQA